MKTKTIMVTNDVWYPVQVPENASREEIGDILYREYPEWKEFSDY